MDEKLEKILQNMRSDEARIGFLKKIYTPESLDIADAILALSKDKEILYTQMNYAFENKLNDRLKALGKEAVTAYLHSKEPGDIVRLTENLKKWNDKELTEYAIARLKDKNTRDSLENAAELSETIGKKEDARNYIEKLFEMVLKKTNKEHHYAAADYALRLGRYNEAIDLYMDANWFDNAFSVAQTNVPQRINEVAEKGFEYYSPSNNPQYYFEFAEAIGKEFTAKMNLQNEARTIQIHQAPRKYMGLVRALLKAGLRDDAEVLTDKIKAHELHKVKRETYQTRNQKELAQLYLQLDNREKAAEALRVKVNRDLERKNSATGFLWDLDQIYELTHDNSVLEKKIDYLERHHQYEDAASTAEKMGRPDMAQLYKHMSIMIQGKDPASSSN